METTHATAPDVEAPPPIEQSGGLLLQRKCACGGSAGLSGNCSKCQEKRFSVQRYSRARSPLEIITARLAEPVSSLGQINTPRISTTDLPATDLAPARTLAEKSEDVSTTSDESSSESIAAETEASSESSISDVAQESRGTAGLIVEDDATEVQPNQMRKGEFINELRAAICDAADAELAAVGRSTAGCPYVAHWLGYYAGRSSQQGEQALRRYAPEAAGVVDARDYIPLIAERVRRAVAVWARTGEVTGVPPEVSGIVRDATTGGGHVFAKARQGGLRESNDPQQIRDGLGAGHPLAGGVRSRMERAFGHDFSDVRVHSDNTAVVQSSRLNARAFTIGTDIAFGAGEFHPGTLVGDALLAHELAHVVQQRGATSAAPLQKGSGSYNQLEEDADHAAVGAVASIWAGVKGAAAFAAANAVPSLRSGLGLQRCDKDTCSVGVKTVTIDLVKMRGSTRTPSVDLAEVNKIYKPCCVQFTAGVDKAVPNAKSDLWLGGDTDVKVTPGCGTVDPEEKAMYDGATAELHLTSRMRAFYAQTFSGHNALGYSIPLFCATGAAAPYVNHLVMKDASLHDTLAHELGHILLNSKDHQGIDNPADKKNLMVSPGRTASDIDASQCKIIYNNA